MTKTLALTLSLLATTAYGQSVKQTGNVTPGHLTVWTTNGVVQDGGVPPGQISSITIGTTNIIGGTNGYCLFVSSSFIANEICPGANGITNLTGDVTASGPGSSAATLATVNLNTGSFGGSTAIPNITVNGKGLITAAGSNAVVAPASTLTGTTLASNVVTSFLTSVGVIAGGTWNGTTIGVAYGGTGLVSGTSGGVLGFTAAGTLASSIALTANLPVIGGGAGATPTVGSVSGNTTVFATTKNALVNGDCVSIDGSGNLVDAGGPCTTGGGGGTVSSGTAGQIGYYATSSTTISGNSNANIASGTLTLGTANTTLGATVLEGNTSGAVTVRPAAVAGTYNFVLPAAAGTAGQPLLSAGGGTSAQTYGTLAVPAGGTGGTTFTANLPLIGNVGGALAQGTRSGNTTSFATTSGSLTNTHCVSIDSNGNLVDNGSACSTSGGTVTSVATGQGLSGGSITTTGTLTTAAGVDTNTLNTQTTNYSVATTDCGKTIQAGTGSTGVFTLTLPAVSGFPANCSVLIVNGDSGFKKTLSGFPTVAGPSLCQSSTMGVKIVNGAWSVFYNPTRCGSTADSTMTAPTITAFTPGDLSVTYADQFASYTRVGNLVTVDFDIVTSSFTHTTASGGVHVTGMPFTSNEEYVGAVSFEGINKAGGYASVTSATSTGLSFIDFEVQGMGLSVAVVAITDMPSGGTVVLRTTVSYMTNDP